MMELPTEVGDFLDYLDSHAKGDMSPATREQLTEVQRRRKGGYLTAPVRPARRASRIRSGIWPRLSAVARLHGLFVIAALLTTMAMWDIARPLGLLTAALGVLYLEHRLEQSGGARASEHSQRHR